MAEWTLNWLRERVRQGHHRVLTKYLVQRSPEVAKDHLAAGWTTDRIVREGFDVKNGYTEVPKDAMTCLRNCPDLDPKIVRDLVFKTLDLRQRTAFEAVLWSLMRKRPDLREFYVEIRDLNTVQEVLES